MSEKKDKRVFVTTDGDMWNSADEAHFVVIRGQVKPLPEVTTPIIDNALEQGLLREATEEEKQKYKFHEDVEIAVREGKIQPGKTYNETVGNFQSYKAQLEAKKMVKGVEPKNEIEDKPLEEPKEEPVEESIEESADEDMEELEDEDDSADESSEDDEE